LVCSKVATSSNERILETSGRKSTSSHGWLQTGDVAIMDQDGENRRPKKRTHQYIWVFFEPSEVEHAISIHPKVLEVGAIGIPDKGSREGIKVFVVKKDSSLTKEELMAHCRERLVKYKLPKYIEFTDSLPKSNVGKVVRRVLKEISANQPAQDTQEGHL
jgi:long-chain acyl-CoA synthetase